MIGNASALVENRDSRILRQLHSPTLAREIVGAVADAISGGSLNDANSYLQALRAVQSILDTQLPRQAGARVTNYDK
jgi:hypothetical protein